MNITMKIDKHSFTASGEDGPVWRALEQFRELLRNIGVIPAPPAPMTPWNPPSTLARAPQAGLGPAPNAVGWL